MWGDGVGSSARPESWQIACLVSSFRPSLAVLAVALPAVTREGSLTY